MTGVPADLLVLPPDTKDYCVELPVTPFERHHLGPGDHLDVGQTFVGADVYVARKTQPDDAHAPRLRVRRPQHQSDARIRIEVLAGEAAVRGSAVLGAV